MIGRTRKEAFRLLKIVKRYFTKHKLQISEKKSKVMLYDASVGTETFEGFDDDKTIEFEKVLSFKYLGIKLNVSSHRLFRDFNNNMKQKAKNYLHNVLNLSREGPDRSELARTLWINCALPSILYGCEIIPVTQDTIDEIDRCQSQVGKYILQVPRSSANVCANIDAG